MIHPTFIISLCNLKIFEKLIYNELLNINQRRKRSIFAQVFQNEMSFHCFQAQESLGFFLIDNHTNENLHLYITPCYINSQMINSRSYRTKTDHSRPPKKYFSIDSSPHSNNITSLNSQTSHHKQSTLTRVLKQINHEVHYQNLSDKQILDQKNMLRKKLKEMNHNLAKVVEKEIQKKNETERINNKAVVSKEREGGYQQQFVDNEKSIQNLELEYHQSNQKLSLLSDPYSKMNLIKKIAEVQLKTKELKQQLSRIKKNKFLRQRQILKDSKSDKSQVSILQTQYISLVKKKSLLTTKNQQISEELSQSQVKSIRQKNYYDELRQDIEYIFGNQPTVAQKEHMNLMYKTSKRKLQIQIKKNEREEQNLKKKYYHCLVQFRNIKNRIANIDHTASHRDADNEKAIDRVEKLTEQLKKNRNSFEERNRKESYDSFMMTEIPKQKIFIRKRTTNHSILRKINNYDYDLNQQGDGRQTPIRSIPRRWQASPVGSIIRQTLSHKDVLNQSSHLTSNFTSNFASQKVTRSGHIKHYRTQGHDPVKQSPLHSSMMQQSYPSDFQA